MSGVLTRMGHQSFAIAVAILLFPVPESHARSTDHGSTIAKLETVHVSVIRFNGDYDRIPTESEGLIILAEKPRNWNSSKPWRQTLSKSYLSDEE